MDLLNKLKDIKPNETIVDYNFYIFVFFIVLVVIVLIYFLIKFFKKKPNETLEKLKKLDLNNSKKTAYEFTKYAKEFVNEENKTIYKKIVEELNNYKYKRNVEKLTPELKKQIKKFIEGIK